MLNSHNIKQKPALNATSHNIFHSMWTLCYSLIFVCFTLQKMHAHQTPVRTMGSVVEKKTDTSAIVLE